MFKMSNVQTPYAIALYWSVHRNPYNGVIVIPIKLGGISYKKNTANNQGFGQSSDVFVHQHSIFCDFWQVKADHISFGNSISACGRAKKWEIATYLLQERCHNHSNHSLHVFGWFLRIHYEVWKCVRWDVKNACFLSCWSPKGWYGLQLHRALSDYSMYSMCIYNYIYIYPWLYPFEWGGLGWGGVVWGWWRSLHMYTSLMLRRSWWGGDRMMTFLGHVVTHLWCYGGHGNGVGMGWWRSLHMQLKDTTRPNAKEFKFWLLQQA